MVQSASFWLVLATAVPVFWLLPRRFRGWFLFLASSGYLMTLDAFSVVALMGWSIVFYFALPVALERSRLGAVVGFVLAISGFLVWFKYVPAILSATAGLSIGGRILVPLGISYYTFKLIHYAVETGRGYITERSLDSFLEYMFLFPIFTAGPIERYDHFMEHREDEWSPEMLSEGGTRIVHGLVKKFVVAEFLLLGLNGSALPTGDALAGQLASISTPEAWALLGIAYLYIYMDFSGYTDLAVGCSRLFGFRITENFRFPVVARNISDFWRRWHISLSAWCQSYIYMPIMGATRIPYLAALASFIVIGVWHAATVTRLAWGLFHFAGIAAFMTLTLARRKWDLGRAGRSDRWPVGGILATQLFVTASMAFLLAEGAGVGTGFALLAKLVPWS